MAKYVLTYDVLSKEKLEKDEGKKFKCKDYPSGLDIREDLIKILCGINTIDSIEWKNNTTITFTSSAGNIINSVEGSINGLGYCIDFYLAKVFENNGYVDRTMLRQKTTAQNFDALVKENCKRLK